MSDSEMLAHERAAEKARKKQKKEEKKRKRVAEEEEEAQEQTAVAASSSSAAAAAAAAPSAADDEDAERAAKKARKAARRAAREREAEVLQAGADALREEAEEDAAAASAAASAAAAAAAAEPSESEIKESKKRHKKEKRERDRPAEEEEAAAAVAAAAAATPMEDEPEETEEQRLERKRAKKEKREKEKAEKKSKKEKEARAAATEAASSAAAAAPAPPAAAAAAAAAAPAAKVYPPPPPGNTTLLLFYQYVRPAWNAIQRQSAEDFTRDSLTRHQCTGRVRCAYEGFNATLTGPPEGIRGFCSDLREYEPEHFSDTDFKIVDGLRDNQVLRGLKVWHVAELVTYGFERGALKNKATIENGGTHLTPQDWHDKAAEDNTVLIDVRNANENAIGRFQPLNDASRVLDPYMRTSTEFPDWVSDNMEKLQKAKNIMMYCTGGIRCERASALLVQKGLPASKVFQLKGGIHRYLDAFPEGGHWIGKNYTFDRRFAHGATAKEPEVVGRCSLCTKPWDRYQAEKKCTLCRMEVLLCRECERSGAAKGKTLKCHLCGGPKPSYLPESEKLFKPKKPKHAAAAGKGEAEY